MVFVCEARGGGAGSRREEGKLGSQQQAEELFRNI